MDTPLQHQHCTPDKAIDWESDLGDVELVIMLTLGAQEGINHVKVFSQLARKLVNKTFRESLFAATTPQSIWIC